MTARRWSIGWLCALAVCAATACLASGCASNSASDPSVSTAPRPQTAATLQIVNPGPNERTATTVEVRLRLDHAHLVPPAQVGGALYPDQGHIHLSVDGQLVAMPLRLDYSLARLSRGSHTVEAEFVASDHLPFANRVVAAVTFEVR